MSTRAVYTFMSNTEDNQDNSKPTVHHVYKHCDGYPSGALEAIENAIKWAWKFPRFVASEFGAAFIAGNKTGEGNLYLTHSYSDHEDLDYRYEITYEKDLMISCFRRNWENDKYKKIFSGTLTEFKKFVTTQS